MCSILFSIVYCYFQPNLPHQFQLTYASKFICVQLWQSPANPLTNTNLKKKKLKKENIHTQMQRADCWILFFCATFALNCFCFVCVFFLCKYYFCVYQQINRLNGNKYEKCRAKCTQPLACLWHLQFALASELDWYRLYVFT